VPGADNYEVTVNGRFVGITRETRFTSHNLWIGDHSLTVKAIDRNWRYSSQSDTAKVYVSGNDSNTGNQSVANNPAATTVASNNNAASSSSSDRSDGLYAPTNPRGTQTSRSSVRWQWDSSNNATQYEVTVDGRVALLTNGLEYVSTNLWAGDHSMTVRAIDSNNNFSAQSATAKIVTQSQFDANNPAQSNATGCG